MKLAATVIGLGFAGLMALIPAPAGASCIERVVVFEMQGCPHCAATRAFLEKNAVPFERVDVWKNAESKAFMVKTFGSPAVPVTTNGARALRGFNEAGLRKLLCLAESAAPSQ